MLNQITLRIVWALWLAVLMSLSAAMAVPAAAQLGPAFTVAGPFVDPTFSSPHPAPRVAIAADGDALFIWRRKLSEGNWVVQARSRSAAGVLGPIQALSQPGQFVPEQEVAVDVAGDA